jgi:hypothetical protein
MVVIFLVLADRYTIYLYLKLFIGATFAGIVLSNITEEFAGKLAERVMNLLTGFGFKDRDAELDEKGVPVVSLRSLGGKYYNAVAVVMIGEEHYANWQFTKEGRYFQYFINCCESLLENLKLKELNGLTFGVWEYYYPWSYNLKPPWISGLAQGVGIQIISRAYKLSGEEKYLKAAKYAFNAFLVEVKDGGVTYKDGENEWWYEEYVGKDGEISRVLNGMIYALLGIHEYFVNTGDREALIVFERGVRSLKRNLNRYDSGWWTYYDDLGMIATKSYHIVHLNLLKGLYEITHERFLFEIYQKWSNYKKGFFTRRFLKQRPRYHDLMVLSLNIAGVFLALMFLRLFICQLIPSLLHSI